MRTRWRAPALHAFPVVALVLYLFYRWFACANRHIVFLYYHDMGPLVPDTSPFSRVTSSRYWMAGLVAGGGVLVGYTAFSWLAGRLARRYRTPDWWRVWIVCALVLVMAIPLITMTANAPVLPARSAAQVTAATLIGLGLALLPGRLAAERPAALAWLVVDGFGLMMILTAATAMENMGRWLANGDVWRVRMTAIIFGIGVGWLLCANVLRVILRTRRPPGAVASLVAGPCVAYLLMPLVHHVGYTDGYYYITDSDNFFARSPGFQILAWVVTGTLFAGLVLLRKRLSRRRLAG